MSKENNQVAVKKDIGSQVLERVNKLCESGFRMSPDFNATNAIKATMLLLQEVVDKNKKPALEVCTPISIQRALFEMCIYSLDVSKKQGYMLVRGDKLCFQPSYFGHILQVKRLFPEWTPIVRVIREGDKFEYNIDPLTGKMKLGKHEQKLENIDKDFLGAYMYLPCADGEQELYVMTRKQIMKAWSKSSSQSLQTHKDFDEKMIFKTIVNSGCTKVINATPTTNVPPIDDVDDNGRVFDAEYEVFEEDENKPQPQVAAPAQEPAPAPQPQQPASAPANNG
jgi:recombination protein RecT